MAHVMEHSLGPSVGLSVCLSVCLLVCRSVRKKCIMAKRLSGSGCRLEWRLVSGIGRGMGVLDRAGDCQRKRGSFGGEVEMSNCNQWGLCDAALLKLLRGLVMLLLGMELVSEQNIDDGLRCSA